MGVSAPYITKLIRGSANLTLDSMVKIANALGCDLTPEIRLRERSTGSPFRARNPKTQKRHSTKTKHALATMVHETPPSCRNKRKNDP